MNRIAAMACAGMSFGCLDPDVLYEVEICGTVTSADVGPVELWFLHNEWGNDSLETHYMIIDTLWLDEATTFSQVLQVPQGTGTGMSVYGWQDRNEDEEHCRPGTAPELSGLVDVEDYPAHLVEIDVTLDTPCEGPEGL